MVLKQRKLSKIPTPKTLMKPQVLAGTGIIDEECFTPQTITTPACQDQQQAFYLSCVDWTDECSEDFGRIMENAIAASMMGDDGTVLARAKAMKHSLSLKQLSAFQTSEKSGFNGKAAMIGSATGLALFFAGYAAMNASKKARKAGESHTPLL